MFIIYVKEVMAVIIRMLTVQTVKGCAAKMSTMLKKLTKEVSYQYIFITVTMEAK